MAAAATTVLKSLLDNTIIITHLIADKKTPAAHDHTAWLLNVRCHTGHYITFWIEGRNIAHVSQMLAPNGERLLDDRYPINILGDLATDEMLALENLVMGLFDQAYTTIQSS